jgi:hypothetical protein
MLSLDLAKAVPDKLLRIVPDNAFVYLGAFVPGLFFEVSILLANPELVNGVLAKAQSAFSLSGYLRFGIALFIAFIVGNVFTLLVCPVIQTLIRHIWNLLMFIWARICRWVFCPFLNWFTKKQAARLAKLRTDARHESRFWRSNWNIYFLRYAQNRAFPTSSLELGKGFACWRVLAGKLLRTKYGVEPTDLNDLSGERWVWLYRTVGSPTAENVRGSMIVIIIHAAGWAGLAASRLAPGLQHRFYFIFCFAMIAIGLYHDWGVARNRLDPEYVMWANIRALLREYRRIDVGPPPEPGDRNR